MDLLARREHSCTELKRKLAARDYAEDEIDTAVAALEAEGLASDARFAEAFVAARVRRGQGPRRIQRELDARGVAPELATAPMDQVDWPAQVRAARVRKFGPDRPGDYKERARQARFLEYRGFTGEQIGRELNATDEPY
jgi:regulatory protein